MESAGEDPFRLDKEELHRRVSRVAEAVQVLRMDWEVAKWRASPAAASTNGSSPPPPPLPKRHPRPLLQWQAGAINIKDLRKLRRKAREASKEEEDTELDFLALELAAIEIRDVIDQMDSEVGQIGLLSSHRNPSYPNLKLFFFLSHSELSVCRTRRS